MMWPPTLHLQSGIREVSADLSRLPPVLPVCSVLYLRPQDVPPTFRLCLFSLAKLRKNISQADSKTCHRHTQRYITGSSKNVS